MPIQYGFKKFYQYQGTEYLRDENGNVFKFLFGLNDTKTKYNYLKFVGKVSPRKISHETNGFNYVDCHIESIGNNLYCFEC